jgi:hypothetical protein
VNRDSAAISGSCPATRRPPSWWAVYGEPLLGIVASVVVFGTLLAVHQIATTGLRDDFTVFLESARWLRAGVDPYQRPALAGPGNNLNTPAAALVFLPFSYLPTAVAYELWTAFAIVALVVAARWISIAVAPGRSLTVAAAVLITQPVIVSLLLGQTTALLMLLVTAAWIADRDDRLWRAGLLMGIAIAAKPFLGLFAFYAIWRRSRALVAGLAGGAAGTLIVGLMVSGIGGYRSWVSALGEISWTAHVLNASLLGFLTRTFTTTPEVLHTTPLLVRPGLVQPLWWVSAAVVIALGARGLLPTRNRDRAWSLILLGSLMLSPLGWMYYAPLAAGPLLAVAMKSGGFTRGLFMGGYLCLLLPPFSTPRLGVTNSALLGSMYALALTVLFVGVLRGGPDRDIALP